VTLPQGAEIPTVPRPLAHLVQPSTDPDISHRFGFRPPPLATTARFLEQRPVVPPPVAVFSNSHATHNSGSSVTTAAPQIAPVAETGGGAIPIDPSLLSHSHSQPDPPPFHPNLSSSSQMIRRQHLAPPLLGQRPLNTSKGHVTGPTIRIDDTSDPESSRDDGETDEDEEPQLGCESDGSSSSSDGHEMIQLGPHTNSASSDDTHSIAQNPVQDGFTSHDFDGDRLQDLGTEDRYDNYDLNDPLLGMFLC
jgi:hypothetical protein